jgi:hypothetical protein
LDTSDLIKGLKASQLTRTKLGQGKALLTVFHGPSTSPLVTRLLVPSKMGVNMLGLIFMLSAGGGFFTHADLSDECLRRSEQLAYDKVLEISQGSKSSISNFRYGSIRKNGGNVHVYVNYDQLDAGDTTPTNMGGVVTVDPVRCDIMDLEIINFYTK